VREKMMFCCTWSFSFRKQKHGPFLLWQSVSRKTISSTPDGKEQERKSPPQMMVAGATTNGIEEWKWGQVREYMNALRPGRSFPSSPLAASSEF
jgi:hypothetical protein